MDAVDDEALWQQARLGGEAAFRELVERYERPLYAFIAQYLGQAAEDLFQETFLKAWRGRRTYMGSQGFRPWLYAIARNLCRDARRQGRRAPRTASLHAGGEEGNAMTGTLPDQRAADPAEGSRRRETAAQVRAAVDELPADHREVVVMRMFRQMSFDDIARITGRSAGTLRSRLHHALRKLRPKLEQIARLEGYLT